MVQGSNPQRELVDRLVSSRLPSRGWPLLRNNHNQNRCDRAGRSHFQKWPTHLRLVDYEGESDLVSLHPDRVSAVSACEPCRCGFLPRVWGRDWKLLASAVARRREALQEMRPASGRDASFHLCI